jgi:hypothetical protein
MVRRAEYGNPASRILAFFRRKGAISERILSHSCFLPKKLGIGVAYSVALYPIKLLVVYYRLSVAGLLQCEWKAEKIALIWILEEIALIVLVKLFISINAETKIFRLSYLHRIRTDSLFTVY